MHINYIPRTRVLLFSIGIIYFGLGIWCTVLPVQTATSLGFSFFDTGIVEYVVVYGGLEVGLGLPMMYAAFRRKLFPGIYFITTFFSLCLAIFRLVMILSKGATSTLFILFGTEILIFLLLLTLNLKRAPKEGSAEG